MVRLLVVGLVVVAVGAGLYMAFGEPAEPVPVAVPIEPPADALFMEPGTEPGAVLMSMVMARGDDAEDMRAFWTGMWTPQDRAWEGEVKEVRVRDGVTRFSTELHGPTLVGMSYVVCEVPGLVDGLERGKVVRYRGRVKDFQPSPDLRSTPHRLIMDQVTVERIR